MIEKKGRKLKLRQLRNNPKNDRWVENMDEFGRACTANKCFRAVFKPIIKTMSDRYISGRLTRRMLSVLQTDRVNIKGERTLHDGELKLLEHFNFNRDVHLFDVMNIPGYEVSYNRETGDVQWHIPSMQPFAYLHLPKEVGYFKVVIAAAAVDLRLNENIGFDHHVTQPFMVDPEWTAPMHFTLHLPANVNVPVFAALGIQRFGKGKGGHLIEDNKKYNAMEIVKVFK